MSGRIIATAINNEPHYMEGLEVFLFSARQNAPEEQIYVCLLGTGVDYGERLKKINTNISTDFSFGADNDPAAINYVRHDILLKLIKTYNTVAWVDNDAIIRKPLDGLWAGVAPDSLKIWYRKYYHSNPKKNKRPECFFQGGVYVIGNDASLRKWLYEIIDSLKGTKDWFYPQALLYLRWVANKKQIKHIQLDVSYNDSTFKVGSHIWHCKQPGFSNETYQKEYQQYLNGIKELGL